jgi:hypothetical protein
VRSCTRDSGIGCDDALLYQKDLPSRSPVLPLARSTARSRYASHSSAESALTGHRYRWVGAERPWLLQSTRLPRPLPAAVSRPTGQTDCQRQYVQSTASERLRRLPAQTCAYVRQSGGIVLARDGGLPLTAAGRAKWHQAMVAHPDARPAILAGSAATKFADSGWKAWNGTLMLSATSVGRRRATDN